MKLLSIEMTNEELCRIVAEYFKNELPLGSVAVGDSCEIIEYDDQLKDIVFEFKPNAKAETSERSGDSSPAICSVSDCEHEYCEHEYESDGGLCIHCGQQGGLLAPNKS